MAHPDQSRQQQAPALWQPIELQAINLGHLLLRFWYLVVSVIDEMLHHRQPLPTHEPSSGRGLSLEPAEASLPETREEPVRRACCISRPCLESAVHTLDGSRASHSRTERGGMREKRG